VATATIAHHRSNFGSSTYLPESRGALIEAGIG
jgi:hypothetical protein